MRANRTFSCSGIHAGTFFLVVQTNLGMLGVSSCFDHQSATSPAEFMEHGQATVDWRIAPGRQGGGATYDQREREGWERFPLSSSRVLSKRGIIGKWTDSVLRRSDCGTAKSHLDGGFCFRVLF